MNEDQHSNPKQLSSLTVKKKAQLDEKITVY